MFSRTMASVFLQLTLTIKRLHFRIVYIKNTVLYTKQNMIIIKKYVLAYKTLYLNGSLDNHSSRLKDNRRGGDNGHGLKR